MSPAGVWVGGRSPASRPHMALGSRPATEGCRRHPTQAALGNISGATVQSSAALLGPPSPPLSPPRLPALLQPLLAVTLAGPLPDSPPPGRSRRPPNLLLPVYGACSPMLPSNKGE